MLFNSIIRVKPYQFLYKNFNIKGVILLFKLLDNRYLIQVLHGCLQSVSWGVRLNPSTDAIPVVNLYLTIYDPDKVSFGTKTSPYGPYELGYRRAIKIFTKWSKTSLVFLIRKSSFILKFYL